MADGDRNAERDASIYRMYIAGLSQTLIAERVNLTQSRVSQICTEQAALVPPPDREALAKRAVERGEWLRAEMARLYERQTRNPPPAFSQKGDPLIDPRTGEVIADMATLFAAWDRMLKADERLAKAVGLDAPTKAHVEVEQVRYVLTDVDDEALK